MLWREDIAFFFTLIFNVFAKIVVVKFEALKHLSKIVLPFLFINILNNILNFHAYKQPTAFIFFWFLTSYKIENKDSPNYKPIIIYNQ